MARFKHELGYRGRAIFVATILLLVLKLVHVKADGIGSMWTYKQDDRDGGPKMWHVTYPECGGQNQSPVRIDTRRVIYDPTLRFFDFSDYDMTEGVELTLENVGGHTAELLVSGRDIFLKGGNLTGMFKLVQLHFHWGENNQRGSEHSLNGKYFPMEVHFVHRLVDPSTGMLDPSMPQSLAVVGFFFRVGGTTNRNYEQLLQYFDLILHPNAETHIPVFPGSDLLPVSKRYHYFRYHGSLTTPPCYETVVWSIGVDKIVISKEQLNRFRSLFDERHHRLVDCYRPVQEINKRTIYTTNKNYGKAMPMGPITNLLKTNETLI